MVLQQRLMIGLVAVLMCVAGIAAEKLTTPTESLNGLRPGTLTVNQLTERFGKPPVDTAGGLLQLYGGATDSRLYGWYMIENPSYTIPDLAVETEKGSNQVRLVMSIGYDGLKTARGIACFQTEDELIQAYGKPAFAFAVPMRGYVLRELYYPNLGISFDLAPTGPSSDRQIVAIYVTYPEYLQRAIDLRKQYIKDGTGQDVTYTYDGGKAT